ncbi:unnamed protein product [Dimorphilus gyrociliatus]|uniref:Uncharacterized protein n=1 Tax=Dimorphilus gyrociliatus TaxID=2664684 RepID=A0A7I8VDG4_9ANNE|nr:unnamed protein product [Dimorphilus gyrociliatus]
MAKAPSIISKNGLIKRISTDQREDVLSSCPNLFNSVEVEQENQNLSNANNQSNKMNQRERCIGTSIDMFLDYNDYLDEEERALTEFIFEKDKARVKLEFEKQLDHLKTATQTFFREKRDKVKALKNSQKRLSRTIEDNRKACKLFVEQNLMILLRSISYTPQEYSMGKLEITGKLVKLVIIYQSEMANCKVVRGMCVNNNEIYIIKWSSFLPTTSTICIYNLAGSYVRDVSKTQAELTAIESKDNGLFYVADMTNNCIMQSRDCKEFDQLIEVEYPQGIAICSDGIIIACDDPKTSHEHTVNIFKYTFDGDFIFHYKDRCHSLYKICCSGYNLICTHDHDNEIMVLDTEKNQKTRLILEEGYTPIGVCSLPNGAFAIANHSKMSLTIYDNTSLEICELQLSEKPVHLSFYENDSNYYLVCYAVY